jgi:hypothetical protein
MRNKYLKYIFIPLIILLVIGIPFINFPAFRVKKYTKEFEKLNQYIIENNLSSKDILYLISNKETQKFPVLKNAIQDSNLCAIRYYINEGVVYTFQCENISKSKFYLIKILNKKNDLLSYEQYIDYSKSVIELENSWCLIEQLTEHN